VFADADGRQYVEDDGERAYGVWLPLADEPVSAPGPGACSPGDPDGPRRRIAVVPASAPEQSPVRPPPELFAAPLLTYRPARGSW
jgi:hypothetical protein